MGVNVFACSPYETPEGSHRVALHKRAKFMTTKTSTRRGTTVEGYYYIFDARAQRAVVVDRRTGNEVVWAEEPRIQLVEYVETRTSGTVLRRFAKWCALEAEISTVSPHTAAGRLWSALHRDPDPQAWTGLRNELTDVLVFATTLGVPRRRAQAARLLVVHACTHPDPRQAAIDAAHMSERWAEFTAHGTDPETTVRHMRQRQIDWLLDVLRPS